MRRVALPTKRIWLATLRGTSSGSSSKLTCPAEHDLYPVVLRMQGDSWHARAVCAWCMINQPRLALSEQEELDYTPGTCLKAMMPLFRIQGGQQLQHVFLPRLPAHSKGRGAADEEFLMPVDQQSMHHPAPQHPVSLMAARGWQAACMLLRYALKTSKAARA